MHLEAFDNMEQVRDPCQGLKSPNVSCDRHWGCSPTFGGKPVPMEGGTVLEEGGFMLAFFSLPEEPGRGYHPATYSWIPARMG